MSEEANESVNMEVAQPAEAEQHNDVSQEVSQAEQRKRNDAEYNWAEMRRQMREKDDEIRDLRTQFSQLTKPTSSREEEDDLATLAKDDILTVAQAERLADKRARKIAEEVLKQREAGMLEERLSVRYPDYQQILSRENLELLNKTEPELAEALSYETDPYKKAVSAYKLMKKLGIGQEVSNAADKKRAAENMQKPVSVNAVTKTSAIGDAKLFENGLTDDLKKQLWKEMQSASKAS